MAAASRPGIEAVAYAQEVVGARRRRDPAHLDGPRRHAAGFDLELTRAIADAVTVPVIASGGVGTLDHLVEGVREGHASAVLAASIFHYGEHSIGEAKRHMAAAGLPMRLDVLDGLRRQGHAGSVRLPANRQMPQLWYGFPGRAYSLSGPGSV